MNNLIQQQFRKVNLKIRKVNLTIAYQIRLLWDYIQNKSFIVCLGDSHTLIFDYIETKKLLPHYRFIIHSVGGATAQGLVNPHSKTDALKRFRNILLKLNKKNYLFFLLGEVDCGFVIWYRSQKYNISVASQLEQSIKNYMAFLEEVKTMGFNKIYVLSVPLPTIVDNQDWGEIANLRKEVQVSQKERTKFTLNYNDKLKEECIARNINFIDITSEQLDENTDLIKPEFVRKNKLNHHLKDAEYSSLIVKKIQEYFINK